MLDALLGFVRENGRVCPKPQRWNELWEMLPSRQRAGGGGEPAAPLILAAWSDTPALLKILRLEDHIRYAAGMVCLKTWIDTSAGCPRTTGLTSVTADGGLTGEGMHECQKLVAAARYLESKGLTQELLSSLHHFSLKGRAITFSATYRYFGVDKQLQRRNLEFGHRVVFVAEQHKATGASFPALVSEALRRWPLR